MLEKMKAEIERLGQLRDQHLEDMKALRTEAARLTEQASQSRDKAQSCQGAIEVLQNLLTDNDPGDDPPADD